MRVVGIGGKLGVDVVKEGSGVTILRNKGVNLVVYRLVLNDEFTIEFTLGVSGVENMHSIP